MQKSALLIVSSLGAGGAERTVSELGAALAQRGWRCGILTLSGDQPDHFSAPPGVDRLRVNILFESSGLSGTISANLRRSRLLRQRITDYGSRTVVSFTDQINVRVLAAMLGARERLVVCERTDPTRHVLGRSWRLARRVLYPRADAVIVQTQKVRDWARSWLRSDRVHVIPGFVRKLPETDHVTRDPLVLGVGRLSHEKGFDLLVRAFARSGLIDAGFRLVILGEGPERGALQDMASELGLGRQFDLPGVVSEPASWMARASVFALPSRYEGFPNALLEAMAMGCPVVASDCSGVRDMVQHGRNGLVVAPDDEAAFSSSLTALALNPRLAAQFSADAIEVRSRFDRESVVSAWERVLLGA